MEDEEEERDRSRVVSSSSSSFSLNFTKLLSTAIMHSSTENFEDRG